MRGYGEMNPPSWVLISGLLKMMDQKFAMKPSLGEAPAELVQGSNISNGAGLLSFCM